MPKTDVDTESFGDDRGTRDANRTKMFKLEFELTTPGGAIPELREKEALAQEIGMILRHKGFFVKAVDPPTPIR
jgi:hypothetical protein